MVQLRFSSISIRATYNIDPQRVAEAVTGRTRAILAVHQMGMPCDLHALMAVASRHDIALIEDAACAAGSQIRMNGQWERIGKPHGQIACFSFHPRKVITTGEGGMLTTSNPEFDRKFRLCRQHGMSVPDTVRHGSQQVIFEDYLVVGFNYRMTDIQAAVGRKQLERLPDLVSRRRALAARYAELLGNIEGLSLPVEPDWARSNWQSYCVRLPDRVDQRAVMQSLLDQGIATRRGIMCSHREAPYSGEKQRHDLRQSELAQDHSILLPIYAQMTEDDTNDPRASQLSYYGRNVAPGCFRHGLGASPGGCSSGFNHHVTMRTLSRIGQRRSCYADPRRLMIHSLRCRASVTNYLLRGASPTLASQQSCRAQMKPQQWPLALSYCDESAGRWWDR